MPRGLTQCQKDIVETILASKNPQHSQLAIAEAAKCSTHQVKCIKKNILHWNSSTAPQLRVQGHPCALTQEEIDVCL